MLYNGRTAREWAEAAISTADFAAKLAGTEKHRSCAKTTRLALNTLRDERDHRRKERDEARADAHAADVALERVQDAYHVLYGQRQELRTAVAQLKAECERLRDAAIPGPRTYVEEVLKGNYILDSRNVIG